MSFRLVPGVRHLSLPWLWVLESASEACQLAVGEGPDEGRWALALDRGAGRGYAVSGSLGGTVDLGGGPADGRVAGLYNGEPVVTDGSRFLFKSAAFGWVVAEDLAEPSEWEETVDEYAVEDGAATVVSTETVTHGSRFWAAPRYGWEPSLGEAAEFEPRGSEKDAGSPVSVLIDAALSRRVGRWGGAGSGISGAYAALHGGGAGVGEIGAFSAPAEGGGDDYLYQAARLL